MRVTFEQSDDGDMEVREASEADLAALVAVLGQRHFFTDRLARQHGGGGVLLAAWLDGRPVGDVFVDCGPAEEPEVRRHLPGVPMLVHLEVLGRLQRRGVGTALIQAGEDTARRLGHRRLALALGWTTPAPGGCDGSAMATGSPCRRPCTCSSSDSDRASARSRSLGMLGR